VLHARPPALFVIATAASKGAGKTIVQTRNLSQICAKKGIFG
jgi:hypothetical protein